MMIHNGRGDERGQEKNEGTLDGVEENEAEGVGEGKIVDWDRQCYPMVYVWLYEWCESTLCTTIEMKSCTPFVYNESKCSL